MDDNGDRDLGERVFLVTGATSGIGRVTATELARRGARVFLACRSAAAGAALANELGAAGNAGPVEVIACDLGDLASVRAAAAAFQARGLPLHGLINNAGLAGAKGLTRDGFELTFGVNHLGHFLLTSLLLDTLRASAPARIVNVASDAHYRVSGIDFAALQRATRSRTGLPEYGVSKLCNVLHARELARRLGGSGVTSYALHPGVVATAIWREVPRPLQPLLKLFMRSPRRGAETTLHCATAPELGAASGRYYRDCRESRPSAAASDEALAARLWAESERFTRPA
jgi:retinol dehydrogenase 12